MAFSKAIWMLNFERLVQVSFELCMYDKKCREFGDTAMIGKEASNPAFFVAMQRARSKIE